MFNTTIISTRVFIGVLLFMINLNSLHGQTPTVKLLDIECNSLIFYPGPGQVILALPAQGTDEQRIAFLDPAYGVIVREVALSEEPTDLALSDDESMLYVSTITRILRYELPLMNLVGEIELGEDEVVYDMKVLPNQNQSICVTAAHSPFTRIRVYDGNQERPVSAMVSAHSITFADTDSLCYGYDNLSTGHSLSTLAIRSDGVYETDSRKIATGFYDNLEYAKNSLWTDSGNNIDIAGALPQAAGRMLAGGLSPAISPSWDEDLMFIYTTGSIEGHNASTYNPVFNYTLDDNIDFYLLDAEDMVTWNNGLNVVVRTEGSILIISDCEYAEIETPLIKREVHGCLGDTVWLSASREADVYFWNNGSQTKDVPVVKSGVYSYTVPDALGCNSAVVELFDVKFEDYTRLPTIDSDKSEACFGEQLLLEARYFPGNFESFVWFSGDTMDEILVHGPGSYSVYAVSMKGCVSPTRTITIDEIPHQAPPKPSLVLDGSLIYCPQQPPLITAPPGYADYIWEPFLLSNTDTARVNISDDVHLVVVDIHGCRSVSSDTLSFVKTNVNTDVPVIYLNGMTLASTKSTGNQWFRDNVEIANALTQFHMPEVPGWYHTRVHQEGCFIGNSNIIPYGVSDVEDVGMHALQIYPNPGTSEISIESDEPLRSVSLLNMSGTIQLHHHFRNSAQAGVLDISKLPPGLYIVVATTEHGAKLYRAKLIKL